MQNEERINVLEGKVEKLEKLVHDLRTKLPPAEVRAESFIVEDSNGNELVQLHSKDGAGVVETKNSDGQELVSLTTNGDGVGIVTTMDGKGLENAKLGFFGHWAAREKLRIATQNEEAEALQNQAI